MRTLEEIEATIARLVEAPFARRRFSSQTLDLRAVVRHVLQRSSDPALIVRINPEDHRSLSELLPKLETELTNALAEVGARTPSVRIVPDPQLPPGKFEVAPAAPSSTQLLPSLRRPQKVSPGLCLVLHNSAPIPVDRSPYRLGRALDNDLVLIDSTVSRYHAVLETKGEDLFVRDLRSTNGTFVNGRRVTQAPLKPGDLLRLGNAEIRIEKR